MKFENIKSDGMKFEYKVLFSADEIEGQIVEAVNERAKTFKMQGFRPGHVPFNIVRNNVETSVMKDVFEDLISKACDEIIKESGAQDLASRPTYRFLTDYEKGNNVEISISLELAPSFEMKPYEFDITKVVPNVPQEEIEAARKDLMDEMPLREKAAPDYAIKPKDEVFYKAVCYVNGVESKKKSFEDTILIPAVITDGAIFLEKFVGKKVRESFDFIPGEDKTLKYEIIIKSIKKALTDIAPEDFAKKRGFKDLAEFDSAIKEKLAMDIESSAFLYHKNQILEAMAPQYTFDLPQGVIDMEMNNIISNVKRELAENKKNGTASEEDLNKTDEDFVKEYTDVVRKRVMLGYILNRIAKEEGITASEKEVQNIIMAEVNKNPMMANQLMEYYSKNPSAVSYKRAEIVEYKVIQFLISKAKVTEVSKTKKEVEELVSKLLED